MPPQVPARLPGDPGQAQQIARMIRVDQAGEYGAARIYDGQLAILGRRAAAAPIQKMAEQERRHLKAFDRLLVERRVRPTLLSPLWNIAGYALGAASALLGDRAAMACTVAVEEVIGEHYRHQSDMLEDSEPQLKQTIEEFRADEIEHRDIALSHDAQAAPFYELLTASVKTGTRLAIWLSSRI